MVWVREQGEPDVELLIEGLLLVRQVGRDSHDVRPDLAEILSVVPQSTRLHDAPWGIGLRVEVHEDLPTVEVLRANCGSVLIEEGERWCEVSGPERRHALLPCQAATAVKPLAGGDIDVIVLNTTLESRRLRARMASVLLMPSDRFLAS